MGFPIAWVFVVISLATGAVRDLAMGPFQGKGTGETALLGLPLDRLNAGEIVLGDCYLAGYFTIALR